ncbi:ABC transporter permease [Arthrobacter sp. B2a2-09]|uniref:ABC transporter permease n=1 Tax=Arthrobacter sp. B2a2-09 TaxID=2952822 RepID=UPI0022CD5AD8|nr:ABC transporter permease [Arthrobacter sp. B2a2-09]MCZ9884544.1 ABC transporter permease [Arthrobacter sp. B2a2-09]
MTNAAVDTARPPLGLAMTSLLRADSIVILNSKTSLVLSTLLPIVILVATTFGKAQSRLGGSSLIIGLALTLGLLTSCLLGFTLALAHDRHIGVLQRLRVTPAPNWMIMTSRLIVQVATNLIASVIVVIVGAIVHGLTLNVGQYLLVIAVALLGAAVFLAIGQALVGLIQSTNAISAIGRLLMIVLLLLGIFGGTGILGDTIKAISDWSPVGALMTLFSDVLNQSAWSGQDTGSLLACVAYIVVFAFIGIRWFRWDSR